MRYRLPFVLLMALAVIGCGCKHGFTVAQPDGLYPLDPSLMEFSVGGEVNHPSRLLFGGSRMTLGKAIASAGGFTPSADRKKVHTSVSPHY
jgi:hypothetical protein